MSPVGNPEDWAENLIPPIIDEIMAAPSAELHHQIINNSTSAASLPYKPAPQEMTKLQESLLAALTDAGAVQNMTKPNSSQAPQYFCRKCMRVVQTETGAAQYAYNPNGNHTRGGRKQCRECHSGVVKYTVEDLAQLLHEQDTLITGARAIMEDNRTLTRTLREATKPKWLVPATCEIISPDLVQLNTEVNVFHKIGTTHPAYELNEEGMARMKAGGFLQTRSSSDSSDEVNRLRREIGGLKRQIATMGGNPAQPPRAQRTINL
jgi:hypothetical protein